MTARLCRKLSAGTLLSLVVFEDRQDTALLRFLKPGFRHCFCLIKNKQGWMVCDPLKRSLVLDFLAPCPLSGLVAHYVETGRTCVVSRGASQGLDRGSLLRPLTCVEIVKRLLGIDAPRVWTPYQLFRHLRNDGSRVYHPRWTPIWEKGVDTG